MPALGCWVAGLLQILQFTTNAVRGFFRFFRALACLCRLSSFFFFFFVVPANHLRVVGGWFQPPAGCLPMGGYNICFAPPAGSTSLLLGVNSLLLAASLLGVILTQHKAQFYVESEVTQVRGARQAGEAGRQAGARGLSARARGGGRAHAVSLHRTRGGLLSLARRGGNCRASRR